jgi:hypothetical protein
MSMTEALPPPERHVLEFMKLGSYWDLRTCHRITHFLEMLTIR